MSTEYLDRLVNSPKKGQKDRMTVYLGGGLCNQLFQWIFGRSVSLARNEELYFERSSLVGTKRAYGLGAFNFEVKIVDHPTSGYYGEPTLRYDPGVYTAPANSYFVGNWQTEKYFNVPVIRKELTLRNPVTDKTKRVIDEILATPKSAFIHVRRGDYMDPGPSAFHGNLGMNYYMKAINYIQERVQDVTFFVFSDDHIWCHANFPGFRIIDHIESKHINTNPNGAGIEHEDLYIMSFCNHAVIPNSSFGWLGAWWGDTQSNRIVIGPKHWFATPRVPGDGDETLPERWVRL